MSILEEIKNDSVGLSVLVSWLGEKGEPVPQETANRRAAICAPCPKNKPTSNFLEAAKSCIALAIKRQLEIKTDYDEQLFMCEVCGCKNSLKVHTPIEHIRSRTPDYQLEKFPTENCWIPKEIYA